MSSILDKRTAIVELFKAGNSRKDICKSLKVNRMLVWRTLKRFEENGDIQNRPGQGRPQTARTPKLVKSIREKIRRNPKRSIQNLAKESRVSYGTMSTLLQKDLKMSPFKHVKKQQLSAQVVDKRLQRSQILLSRIQDGMLPNLIFSDEKKFDVEQHFNTQNDQVWSRDGVEGSRVVTRKQYPTSVMVWAAVTESGKSLLFFVDQGVKLNQQNYRDDILVGALLPWAQKHFKKRPWSFQQDSAPSHGAKKTQEWLSENVPHFIPKEEWPPSSPDLNPLDFGIWSYLENKVLDTRHQSLEALKVKLQKEWAKVPQKVICDTCKAFPKRLQLVIDADGGHIK